MVKNRKNSFLNRIVIVIAVFVVWMLFFDQNNWINQYKLSEELKEVQRQEHYYQQEIISDSIQLHALKTDINSVEKYAREHYKMKKDEETVFYIIEEDKKEEK
nr:septum formation initiator family protein [Bacteroidota bacterium]